MTDTARSREENISDMTIQQRFDDLYARTNRRTQIYLTSRCRQVDDLRDLFQETYLEVFQALRRSRGRLEFRSEEAFVIHIASQKLAKYYSQKAMTSALPLERENEEGDVIDLGEWVDFADSDEPSIDERLVTEDLLLKIRKHLSGKPELVRKIFYLHYDLDLTLLETAEELNVPLSTVKSRLYRTLRELRRIYHVPGNI